MSRTTISLPPELHKRVRIMAAKRGISMAALIREAIEEKALIQKLKPRSLGAGDSGRADLSEKTAGGLGKRPKRLMPRSIGIGASGFKTTARDSSDFRFEPPAWR